MKRIDVKSYGKINLSLDVLRRLENGYHQVEMVMQQILLHDDVIVRWFDRSEIHNFHAEKGPIEIEVSTNRPYLPRDERNLAYKAAMLMADEYGGKRSGKLRMDIKKRIPVAAGLAGGSGNGAAVLHGINRLWNLRLDVKKLCELGSKLGSDVPFSIMGQAKGNPRLHLTGDPLATHCAVAQGTGTELVPIKGLKSYLVLSKPPIGVSTAEAYQGLDFSKITKRPDTQELIQALEAGNDKIIEKNLINVLETFTLKRYPSVMYTKNNVQRLCGKNLTLMSGSGPTIFALCKSKAFAQSACLKLSKKNKETFWSRTTF